MLGPFLPSQKVNTMTAIPNRPVDGTDNGDYVTDNNDNTSTLHFNCVSCGIGEHIILPTLGLYNYIVRRDFIQKAFPELSAETREAIMMRTCISCTKAIWENLNAEDE